MAPKIDKKIKYWEGVGRRKASTVRVRLYDQKLEPMVNDKTLNDYFPDKLDREYLSYPLQVAGVLGKMSFTVVANGGGITGWKDSIRLGLARALIKFNDKLKPALKKEGLLTRDPRIVERKKAGFKKARKEARFSKR